MPSIEYSKIVSFDLETTGFSKKKHNILEIGAVSINPVTSERKTLSILIPQDVPKKITEITGISKKTFSKESKHTLKEALNIFMEFASSDNTLFIGHNIQAFDLPFINKSLRAHSIALIDSKKCFDTILQMRADISKKRERTWFWTQFKAKAYRVKVKTNLKAACLHYKVHQKQPAHRALPDALNTLEIFLHQVRLNKWPIKINNNKQ